MSSSLLTCNGNSVNCEIGHHQQPSILTTTKQIYFTFSNFCHVKIHLVNSIYYKFMIHQ